MFTYYQPFAYAVGIRRVADFIIAFTLTVCSLRLAAGGLIDRIGSPPRPFWRLDWRVSRGVLSIADDPGHRFGRPPRIARRLDECIYECGWSWRRRNRSLGGPLRLPLGFSRRGCCGGSIGRLALVEAVSAHDD